MCMLDKKTGMAPFWLTPGRPAHARPGRMARALFEGAFPALEEGGGNGE